jgi:hypothetical protein
VSKSFEVTLCLLVGIIILSVAYGQNTKSEDFVSVLIKTDPNYGKSNIVLIKIGDGNSTIESTIIGALVRADFSTEGSVTSASGTFNLLFDGVVKKTVQMTAKGSVLVFDSNDIQAWDSGNYSTHSLMFQVTEGSATVKFPGEIFESRLRFTPSNSSLTVSVKKSDSLTITINHTKIDSTLTDFPLMVRLTAGSPMLEELSWKDRKKFEVTQWGQQLYVEIESWNSSSAVLWVKVPIITDYADTVLNLSFNASMPENIAYIGDTLDSATPNVWSNGYVSVFHLNGNAIDSASARNHGIIQGGVTWVTGPLGDLSARFDGSSGVIVVPDNPGYSSVNNGNKLAQECWLSPETVNWRSYISPLGKGRANEHETKWNLDGGTTGAWKFYILNSKGSYGSGARSSPVEAPRLAPSRVAGEWYMLHGQVIGNLIAIYEGPGIPGQGAPGVGGDIDEVKGWNDYTKGQGVPDGSSINPSDTLSPFYIGRYGGYDPEWQSQNTVPLRIYEVRLSSVNRSIAWMKADYYSQLDQLISIL